VLIGSIGSLLLERYVVELLDCGLSSTLGWLLSGLIGLSQFAGDTCTHLVLHGKYNILDVQDPVPV